MAFLAATDSELFAVAPGFASAKSLYYPPGVAPILRRVATGGPLANRQYMFGKHTANIVIDEHHRALRMSIPRPGAAPSVSANAGTTLQILYTRFYDEMTDERGPLSAGTTVTGGTTRTWTLLPTVVPGESLILDGTVTFAGATVTGVNTNFLLLRPGDRIARTSATNRWARVRSIASAISMTIDDAGIAGAGVTIAMKAVSRCSHVELWNATNGALPRMIMRVRLGTTGVVETGGTFTLGEAEVTAFTAMPVGALGVAYHRRTIVAGVKGHEDTAYISMIGFGERWAGLEFSTEDGSAITGMFLYDTYVVLLCRASSHTLDGVADEDYVLRGLSADTGGYGMWIQVRNVAYIPGDNGLHAFNGAFHSAIPTRESEWKRLAKKYKQAFENGWMSLNKDDQTVQFHPNTRMQSYDDDLDGAPIWIGHYNEVGAQNSGQLLSPEWVNDTEAVNGNETETSASYMAPGNSSGGAYYRGTASGKIWEEDVSNTIPFVGNGHIVLRADHFGDYGGKRNEAKKLVTMDSYVVSELSAWELVINPGDERAWVRQNTVAPYVDDVAASAIADYTPKTVHNHPVVNLDARSFTFEYIFINPVALEFYGNSGFWARFGIATRLPIVAVILP